MLHLLVVRLLSLPVILLFLLITGTFELAIKEDEGDDDDDRCELNDDVDRGSKLLRATLLVLTDGAVVTVAFFTDDACAPLTLVVAVAVVAAATVSTAAVAAAVVVSLVLFTIAGVFTVARLLVLLFVLTSNGDQVAVVLEIAEVDGDIFNCVFFVPEDGGEDDEHGGTRKYLGTVAPDSLNERAFLIKLFACLCGSSSGEKERKRGREEAA